MISVILLWISLLAVSAFSLIFFVAGYLRSICLIASDEKYLFGVRYLNFIFAALCALFFPLIYLYAIHHFERIKKDIYAMTAAIVVALGYYLILEYLSSGSSRL